MTELLDERELFVTCPPGLEEIVLQEIKDLGFEVSRAGYGGLFVRYNHFSDVYKLNLCLRTASRVLLPLTCFYVKDKNDLYEGAKNVDWERYFARLPTFAIEAHGEHRAFNNTLYAAQCVKDAICDRLREKLGRRPNVDTSAPDIRLSLFFQGTKVSLSFDTSGKPLHERGYRLEAGQAPIRENLAAALLRIAGYNENMVFADPCAGSGTFLIEALMQATNTPSQFLRQNFGFMFHPEYSVQGWNSVREEAMAKRRPAKAGHFIAIESDIRTFKTLQRASEKAGFAYAISAICGDFQQVDIRKKPNFVVSNPPYGKRLSEIKGLSGLYKSLGDFMKHKTEKPARGFILTGDMELAKHIGLKPLKRHIVNNGGIECRFLEYDLY